MAGKSRKKTAVKGQDRSLGAGIAYIALGVFFLLPFFMPEESSFGVLGGFLLSLFQGLFGNVLILVALFMIFTGAYGLFDPERVRKSFYVGVGLFLSGIFLAFHLSYIQPLSLDSLLAAYGDRRGGGLAGAFLSNAIYMAFGKPGIYIVMFSFFALGGTFLVNNIAALHKLKDYSAQVLTDLQEDRQIRKDLQRKGREQRRTSRKEALAKKYESRFLADAQLEKEAFQDKKDSRKPSERKMDPLNIKGVEFPEFQPHSHLEQEEEHVPAREAFKPPASNAAPARKAGSAPKGWVLPPPALLATLKKDREYNKKAELETTARLLEDTLRSFGINIHVKDVSCGPAITRYEAVLEPGTKVSKIQNLSEDIALALAATSVRIEAPIPGKSAVGFEVPNKKVSPVSFKEIILSSHFKESEAALTMGIGKDLTGRTVATSLADMPHLLIAGSTGSGKSVCLNTIICSLLFKYTPDEVKFLLIDPKKVELSIYNDIPHLVAPVVTEPKKASAALKWMVNEMERRYQQLSDHGVRDIRTFNEQAPQDQKMPYVVIIIDELADLMMAAPVDVETYICRLAQKARAAGLHLIVATQRPSVQVITGDIKSNIPMRIAFAVFSQIDARTILDTVGAEKLLGKGDMLFTQKGGKLLRIQGAFISEEEILEVTAFLKKQGRPEYLRGAEVLEAEEGEDGEQKASPYEDELLKEAARLVLESGQASISMLQRKLRVGYSRAARLIDMLEEIGFVGPFGGTKSREVTGNWENFGNFFGE